VQFELKRNQLTSFMQNFQELPAKEIIPGFSGRFIHGEQLTLAFWEIKAGCVMPQHHHTHEQITHILKGELKMQIGGEEFLLKRGSVQVIPSNISHGAIAKTDCRVIDAFSPARDDYRF
jgi:quercetin dioxygenase-like cupin family protein